MQILVVAHDAGGAEVVSSWVTRQLNRHCFEFLLEGPARAAFARKLGDVASLSRADAFNRLPEFDLILTGSGWATDLEKRALQLARARGVRSATYLDHWTEYRRRFELNSQHVLPTEIWAGDRHALELAKRLFPEVPVRLEPNRYFEDMVHSIERFQRGPRPAESSPRILYVCEPVSVAAEAHTGDRLAYGYDEHQALRGFLELLRDGDQRVGAVRVRLHPSEPPGKYEAVIGAHVPPLPIETSTESSLARDCAWADWVVGCDSMAMVIALLAGKRVLSCIPAGGKQLTLPYPEIELLFQSSRPRVVNEPPQ